MPRIPLRPPYALLLSLLVSVQGCRMHLLPPAPIPVPVPAAAPSLPRSAEPPLFVDRTEQAGLHYRWEMEGKRPLTILQSIGNGCAFLDYDNDGNQDILLVGPRLALYRGDGKGHFTEVTREMGLDTFHAHFLGCAVGDYDNDGYEDLYISAYRGGILLHNEAGKRFRETTQSAGLEPQPWGSSCTFADLDGDGKLDLYIGGYLQFGPGSTQLCNQHGVQTACGPIHYPAERGVLYRNLGGGRFRNVTAAWSLDAVSGKTLGVAVAPFGRKAHPTLALSNDQIAGDLLAFHGGKAENLGAASGMAVSGDGDVYGGMGIDWGDYDNDGRLDLVIATYRNQAKPLFHNEGEAFAVQDTTRMGMLSSVPFVAFGAKWLDYDNDGWLDLMFTSGHIQDNIADVELFDGNSPGARYRQPALLYHNLQGRSFAEETPKLSGGAEQPLVGRGLAVGDYDNDGRMDALVTDAEGSVRLLHNVTPHPGNWLQIRLIGKCCNRDGFGATVTLEAAGRTLVRHCHADGSYLSSSDPRLHFGVGAAARIDRLLVRWPDGHTDERRNVPVNRILTLQEGAGNPPPLR